MNDDSRIADILEKQTSILAELASQKELHTKTPASFGTYTELHGNGSLFGSESVERDVVTAHIRPTGLGNLIPSFPSVFENPRYATITGITDDVGSEPTNPCDDAPAGFLKGCNLTAAFGRVQRDTQTVEIDKVMLRRNRGDFTDLVMRGRLLGENLHRPQMTEADVLNVVTKSEMVIAGVSMERKLHTLTWQGNPTNNTAGGGYKEFPGLDRQIATGQVDAETNSACAALNSDVKSFNYNAIDGNQLDIVEYLSMLEFFLRYNAERMGLAPVQWAIVMRPELWFELSSVWPCRYLTNRCAADIPVGGSASNPVVINDNVNVSMRDAMRNGNYIDINGNRYPVIVDTGIFESTNVNNANVPAGSYASSIYMVPLTIVGGWPVLYWEFVDYQAASSDIALLNQKQNFWTDDGRYFWTIEQIKWCYKLSVKTEPRIILRTPQLAGRIDSVLYSPLQHLRSADPDEAYWVDGGVSLRANETTFHVW
jgi:hypothetical protein